MDSNSVWRQSFRLPERAAAPGCAAFRCGSSWRPRSAAGAAAARRSAGRWLAAGRSDSEAARRALATAGGCGDGVPAGVAGAAGRSGPEVLASHEPAGVGRSRRSRNWRGRQEAPLRPASCEPLWPPLLSRLLSEAAFSSAAIPLRQVRGNARAPLPRQRHQSSSSASFSR